MLHKISDFEKGIKIESVGMYLEEIRKINENRSGESTGLFFRGQEVEFWRVEPSIFRDDMLSIEHTLMLTPLQKIPMEFRSMQDTFEIMTKYQHYGMCTRLLDLTTNPLVALYFACKKHGEIEYTNDGITESMEPFGMIFFAEEYSTFADDEAVRIITFLSRKNLEKENDIESILKGLVNEGIISEGRRREWMTEEHIKEFVSTIQHNYLVMPSYSNERLVKQSGAFLLPGLFGFMRDNELKKSVITKCKKDLRDEFDDTYFYIDGSNKDSILKELNWYNINESTLFPELEHQLNHIKRYNQLLTKPVTDFNNYSFVEKDEKRQEIITTISEEAEKIFNESVKQFVFDKFGTELGEKVFDMLQSNMLVDWYKRDNIKSKMKMGIVALSGEVTDNPKQKAAEIVNYMVEEYIMLSAN